MQRLYYLAETRGRVELTWNLEGEVFLQNAAGKQSETLTKIKGTNLSNKLKKTTFGISHRLKYFMQYFFLEFIPFSLFKGLLAAYVCLWVIYVSLTACLFAAKHFVGSRGYNKRE